MRATVEQAVRREVRQLGLRLTDSSLAGAALLLARRLDDPATSASASAAMARELRETMAAVRALAPKEGSSVIDEIAKRRAKRRLEAYG